MVIRTLSDTVSGWPYISVNIDVFKSLYLSQPCESWCALFDLVDQQFVVYPIIYRLVPSPFWFEIRQ